MHKTLCLILIILPCISWGGVNRLGDLSFSFFNPDQIEGVKVVSFTGYLPLEKRAEFFANQSPRGLEVSLEGNKIKKVYVIRIKATGAASKSNIDSRYLNKIAFIVELDDGKNLFIFDAILRGVPLKEHAAATVKAGAGISFVSVSGKNIVFPYAVEQSAELGLNTIETSLQQVTLLPDDFSVHSPILHVLGIGQFRAEFLEEEPDLN